MTIPRLSLIAVFLICAAAVPSAQAKTPVLEVTGIVHEEPRRAVVNGILVKEGESVEGRTVEKIGVNFVIFRYRDKQITEYLGRKTPLPESAKPNKQADRQQDADHAPAPLQEKIIALWQANRTGILAVFFILGGSLGIVAVRKIFAKPPSAGADPGETKPSPEDLGFNNTK
ncbi:MAG: hypothetical protein NC924_06360 [Candidatus Omnitrophica bacterium]|nr:hypothetical protein [Candidatus Omnitrophota bacterium]